MSVLDRIISTAKGAAARGGTSAGRRPAGGAGGRRRTASGTNPMVERGVRTAMNALRRRSR